MDTSRGIVVVGQVGRDLVLRIDDLPEPGSSAPVRSRMELLGGKGANQAVAVAQLGMSVALIGAVGDDMVGEEVLAQARADGIDVSHVARRVGQATGLIVEILDGGHEWRYLEDLPLAVELMPEDVERAAEIISRSGSVIVQLQQPPEVALTAATLGRRAGCRVVLDGAPEPEYRDVMVKHANVLRADPRETELLVGRRVETVDDAVAAARELLEAGPDLVALAVEGEGNLFAWPQSHVFYPLEDSDTVDTTGAGDALVAALTTALELGKPPIEAARWAVTASSLAVGNVGGRPRLTTESMTNAQ